MTILTTCFKKDDDLVTRSIAGETIIVPVKSHVADLNSIYTLNEVGSTIWQLIDGRRQVGQIVGAVQHEYDVTAEEAARDILDFLDSLRVAGMIRPVEGS